MNNDKHPGRPTNQAKIAGGEMIVSKACKICQSSVRNEITQDILNGVKSKDIIEKYRQHFEKDLSPTNIHSHKQHISPEAAVQEDRKKALAKVSEYDDATKALYEQRYNKTFDKVRAADELYKQRLLNLFHVQHLIEEINVTEEYDGELDDSTKMRRAKLVIELETLYKGFNQDLVKHIALDADLYVKQVSLQYIESLKRSFLRFTQKFMDVLVKEIDDQLTRERVVEQLGDLLDAEIKPDLDPNKAIDAEFEEVKSENKSS